MFSPELTARAQTAVEACHARGVCVATAESRTGGLVAACLTEIPGASSALDCGFVTYANEAKTAMLGVSEALLIAHGAVSESVSRAMAEGGLARSRADVCVSCTGIAGPGGGTESKPVGLVHLACAATGKETLHLERRYGDLGRSAVRAATVADALDLILQQLDS